MIGDQVWMAENLNYVTRLGSWCYDDQSVNCDKYGRLYNWETAMNACPPGWHLPSDAEWTTLTDFVESNPGIKLKAKSGWSERGNGTDDYGFSALPGGGRLSIGHFFNIGYLGSWWSSNGDSSITARACSVSNDYGIVSSSSYHKDFGFSVRCVRNN